MNPRILFIGGTPRGLELIKLLIRNRERVVFAYIMKEDQHEQTKSSVDIKKICQKYKIPAKICKKITQEEIPDLLKFRPGVAFVCGWRTIIPASLYNRIPQGCIAAHDSLLPKYRGFAPLNWAIINGEKQTGVTLFKIQDGPVDSGDIFGQKIIKIAPHDYAADVYSNVINASLRLYESFLVALKKKKIYWKKQDESLATHTCKRTPDNGEIDWNKSSREVFNFIRALSPPYPCAWTRYRKEKFFIERAALPTRQLKYAGNIPGRIVSIQDDGALILCGKGQVLIQKIRNKTNQYMDLRKFCSSITITFGK